MSQVKEQAEYQKAPSVGWATKAAWAWLRQNYSELWGRTRYPFILLAMLGLLSVLLAPPSGTEELSSFEFAASLVLVLVSAVVTAMLAIATHRLVLLGSDGVAQDAPFALGKREVRFVLYEIALYLCAAAALLCVGLIVSLFALAVPPGAVSLLMLIGLPLGMVIVVRLSFVLPAVALDKEVSLAVAWKQSRGWLLSYSIAVFLAMCVIFLPLVLPLFAVMSFFLESVWPFYILDAVFAVLTSVAVWVMAIVLSVSYGHAVSHSNSVEPQELAKPSDRLE